jgi:hypothetical protein
LLRRHCGALSGRFALRKQDENNDAEGYRTICDVECGPVGVADINVEEIDYGAVD